MVDKKSKEIAKQERDNAKGKRGFQRGNKLASKEVRDVVAEEQGVQRNVLSNPRAAVVEILKEKKINAAHEMIKAARQIKNPTEKFKAWRDIHNFIEGPRKAVDVNINKSEEKEIRITYRPTKSVGSETERQPLQRVKIPEPVDAEFKVVDEEKVQSEVNKRIQDEINSAIGDGFGSEKSK